MKKLIAAVTAAVAVLIASQAIGFRGGLVSTNTSILVPSQRTVLNMNAGGTYGPDGVYEYSFINHIQIGSTGIAPTTDLDTFWFTPGNSPQWNSAIFDANGWPNAAGVSGHSFGDHVLLPASSNYSTYVITWVGQGQLSLTAGTWTTTAITGTGCVTNSNGNWTGTNCRIEVTYSGGQQQVGWRVLQTNQSAGGYFRGLKFFRTADEADLNAGLIFRAPYKQILANLNPSAIRFMNWTGGNDARQNRFENRGLPTYAIYGGGYPTISPPYTDTSTANLMTLGSATGMPVTMQHGEVVTARIGAGLVRAAQKTVSAITKANPGVVTATAHGFNTGDTVVFVIGSGMTQLDHWNLTATVIDANTFSIGIDTTSFTTFASGTVQEYVSLNVGARGSFPVVATDGSTPLAANSNKFLTTGNYRTFYFDKKLKASRDGSGNLVAGAWMIEPTTSGGSASTYDPYIANVPLEICTALVNEVNAISTAGPIHMWMNIPHWGLSTMDPDYSAQSNFGNGAANVVLNGANGFAGLTVKAELFIEYSNERWNGAFIQTAYLERLGFLTYGGSQVDTSSYSSVRAVVMASNIKAALPPQLGRIKFVQAIQGGGGYSGGPNVSYTQGTTNYFTDPNITALSTPSATPISYHDFMAFASYFDPPSGTDYMTKVGTGGFTDDSAMFAGTTPYSSPNQAQAIANFVAQVTSGTNGQSINLYTGFLSTYAAAMVTIGKTAIQYEGAQDWNIASGTTQGGHLITGPDQTFLLGVQASSNWAVALTGFLANFKTTPGAAMPSLYLMVNQRWGYTTVNNTVTQPDDYSGGVEGGALNATWTALGSYNAGLQ